MSGKDLETTGLMRQMKSGLKCSYTAGNKKNYKPEGYQLKVTEEKKQLDLSDQQWYQQEEPKKKEQVFFCSDGKSFLSLNKILLKYQQE